MSDDRVTPSGAPAVPEWERDRPWIVVLTSHWLTMVGLALGITAVSTWLFFLPAELPGNIENPYKGAVLYLILPFVLVTGVTLEQSESSSGGGGFGSGWKRSSWTVGRRWYARLASIARFQVMAGLTVATR